MGSIVRQPDLRRRRARCDGRRDPSDAGAAAALHRQGAHAVGPDDLDGQRRRRSQWRVALAARRAAAGRRLPSRSPRRSRSRGAVAHARRGLRRSACRSCWPSRRPADGRSADTACARSTAMATQARALPRATLDSRLADRRRGRRARTRSPHRSIVVLDRLGSALSTQRRFMADASHELRTPVSIMRDGRRRDAQPVDARRSRVSRCPRRGGRSRRAAHASRRRHAGAGARRRRRLSGRACRTSISTPWSTGASASSRRARPRGTSA